MRAARTAVVHLALIPLLLVGASDARAEDLFEITEFASEGRSVAAEFAELNGDGRIDLFVVALIGIPPEERRTIRVYLQRPDGSFGADPHHAVSLPRWSAVYDVADLREESPGEELVLLRPDGVTLLSLADTSGTRWQLPVSGPTTMGLADDERGFERFRMVYRDFGPEPWILVPQIGQLSALSPRGEVRAQLAISRRANYLTLPTTGLLAIESDLQIFLDAPKLAAGDVDGDGRVDIVSSTRHELRVFLRREDGSFPFEPSRALPLRLVTPRDHARGSGGVASEVKDIDADGRLDLLLSHVRGAFADATTTIYVYMNRDGGWDLSEPTQTLMTEASLVSNALYDLDRDGRRELVRLQVRFSLLELVEFLLSREVDIDLSVHRYVSGVGFGKKPWMKKKLSLPFSFETFRFKGFLPTATTDVNSDGYLDLVSSGGGKSIEVFLGDRGGRFAKRAKRQKIPTAGVIHFADFDQDGLQDFVIFDPHRFDIPVRIGRNRGLLPGNQREKTPEPS